MSVRIILNERGWMIDHQFGDEDHHLDRYMSFGRTLDKSALAGR